MAFCGLQTSVVIFLNFFLFDHFFHPGVFVTWLDKLRALNLALALVLVGTIKLVVSIGCSEV